MLQKKNGAERMRIQNKCPFFVGTDDVVKPKLIIRGKIPVETFAHRRMKSFTQLPKSFMATLPQPRSIQLLTKTTMALLFSISFVVVTVRGSDCTFGLIFPQVPLPALTGSLSWLSLRYDLPPFSKGLHF